MPETASVPVHAPFPRGLFAATAAGSLLLLLVVSTTYGLRPEHVAVTFFSVWATVWSPRTRRFYLSALPFLLAAIAYDVSRLLRPLLAHLTVHVREPYAFDLAVFGIPTAAGRITPNELFLVHHAAPVDLVTGTAYILYIYETFAFAVALSLFARAPETRHLLRRFGWMFLGVNLAGIVTYYLYPAAPPWYAQLHGFGPVDLNTPPNPAAATRWDELTGIPYFAGFYSRGATVFGAIPSLHAALPFMCFLYARELGHRWLTFGAFAFFLLVCFAAVYLQHHYVLDLLVGVAYGFVGYGIERYVTRRRALRKPLPPA